MWINNHPYLFIYLLGCVIAGVLTIIKAIILSIVYWITKSNIIDKNLKKVMPPEETGVTDKVMYFFAVLVIESVLSWVAVISSVWQIIVAILRTLRDAFESTPEEIKLLRFPLKNNPNMPREAVWAYSIALKIKAGEIPPSESDLIDSLNVLHERDQFFDRKAALTQLKDLNVMSADVISSAIDHLPNTDPMSPFSENY